MGQRGALGLFLALAVAVLGALSWYRPPHSDLPATEKGAPSRLDALARSSQDLLPKPLAALHLGMNVESFRAARPRAVRNQAADETSLIVYDEELSQGARAIYLLDRERATLRKVQIARELSRAEDIEPRVRGFQREYGPPSAIWDCPASDGQLPTRRFSWTRSAAGAMDVYVILGDRIAATLYVADSDTIRQSIAKAKCVPTPPERFSKFPVVAPSASAPSP